jgi:hypothetical protein
MRALDIIPGGRHGKRMIRLTIPRQSRSRWSAINWISIRGKGARQEKTSVALDEDPSSFLLLRKLVSSHFYEFDVRRREEFSAFS